MGCPVFGIVGGTLTFSVNVKGADNAPQDADAVPTYKVYETEIETPIVTGAMSKMDDDDTTGFYAETLTLSAGSGFEENGVYTLRIECAVGGVSLAKGYTFQCVTAGQASALGTGDGTNAAVLAQVNNRLRRSETNVDTHLRAAVKYITALGDFLTDRESLALAAGEDHVSLPTDCKAVTAVSIDDNPLGLMTSHDYEARSASDAAAEPSAYNVWDGEIRFDVVADDAYTVDVSFSKYHGDTVSTLELGAEFNEAVSCLTTAYVAWGRDLDEAGAKWSGLFDRAMAPLMPAQAQTAQQAVYNDI